MSNVQLAKQATGAEHVLPADVFEQGSLMGILPKLLLHQAVVKAVHVAPEGQPCCALPCCCQVQ